MTLYIFNTSILEGIYLCSKVTTLRCYCILFLTKQFLACFHILVVTTGIIYHMHRNVLQIVSNSQSSFLTFQKKKFISLQLERNLTMLTMLVSIYALLKDRLFSQSSTGNVFSQTIYAPFPTVFICIVLYPFQNVGRFDFFRFIYFTMYLNICYI